MGRIGNGCDVRESEYGVVMLVCLVKVVLSHA